MSTKERLEQLERRNRRLSVAVVLMGVAAAVVVAAGMAKTEGVPNVLRARSFEVVDENGKVRAKLHICLNEPCLDLYDENDKHRVSLWVRDEADQDGSGPAFEFLDEKDTARAVLTLGKEGPQLSLCDEKGKKRVTLASAKDLSMLILSDKENKSSISLARDDKASILQFTAEHGFGRAKTAASLLVVDGKNPSLDLYGPYGKVPVDRP